MEQWRKAPAGGNRSMLAMFLLPIDNTCLALHDLAHAALQPQDVSDRPFAAHRPGPGQRWCTRLGARGRTAPPQRTGCPRLLRGRHQHRFDYGCHVCRRPARRARKPLASPRLAPCGRPVRRSQFPARRPSDRQANPAVSSGDRRRGAHRGSSPPLRHRGRRPPFRRASDPPPGRRGGSHPRQHCHPPAFSFPPCATDATSWTAA